jgi:hypothetical protein
MKPLRLRRSATAGAASTPPTKPWLAHDRRRILDISFLFSNLLINQKGPRKASTSADQAENEWNTSRFVISRCFGSSRESARKASKDQSPVPGQNLKPDVLMMQPAQDWNRGDTADLLGPTKIWSILLQ